MLRLERLESRENPSGPTLVDPTAILGGNPTTVPPATSTPPATTPGTPPPAVDWSWLLGSGGTGGVPVAPPTTNPLGTP